MVHIFLHKPNFYAVLISTVIPSLIVIVIGLCILTPLGGISSNLYDKDCKVWDKKAHLREAYVAAQNVFNNCVLRLSEATNSTPNDVISSIALQDCDEYSSSIRGADAYREWRKEWNYLAELERTQGCSGWCGVHQPSLWTLAHKRGDACNIVVASFLDNWVQRM